MDFNKAKRVLQLDEVTPEKIKQNYHKLSLKHHPDKGGNPDDFVQITEAYNFFNEPEKTVPPQFQEKVINLNDIFRSFISNTKVFSKKTFELFTCKKEVEITITPKEFLQGTTKSITISFKTHCTCEQTFCDRCRGFSFNGCNKCMGSGIMQDCGDCTNGFIQHTKKATVVIPPKSVENILIDNTIVIIKVNDNVVIKDSKLYYKFNITLKESLCGFEKTFKDPFGIEHTIQSNSIIKQNDGYRVCENVYLLFQINYPKKLLKQLKHIDF
jgi:DnaJ family protein A protein 2